MARISLPSSVAISYSRFTYSLSSRLRILIQPVLDGYPAAGKVALVADPDIGSIQNRGHAPWTYGKRIDTAGAGTGRGRQNSAHP